MLDSTDIGQTLYEDIAGDKARELSSHMNFNFCTTEQTDFRQTQFVESKFKIRRLRWEIYGNILPSLSYHFRQSLNANFNPNTLEGINNAIEMAFLRWNINKQVEMVIGKQFINLSGYECWTNGVNVREFSDFNDVFNPSRAGISVIYKINPQQSISLQATNSLPTSLDQLTSYTLPESVEASKAPLLGCTQWIGYFADNSLMIQYSAAFGNMTKGKNLLMLTAGHVWERGPVKAYLDFMYSREGIDSRGFISETNQNAILSPDAKYKSVCAQDVEYFTTIANIDYRIHKHWNVFLKGAYETASVYKNNVLKENGEFLFKKGLYKRTWNGQFCVEYIPIPQQDNMRFYAHFLYKKYHYTPQAKSLGILDNDLKRITIGLVYTIPVF